MFKKIIAPSMVLIGSLIAAQVQAFTPFSSSFQLPTAVVLSVTEDLPITSNSSSALGPRQVFHTNTRYCNGAIVDLLYNFHQNQTGSGGGAISYQDQSLIGAFTVAGNTTTNVSVVYPGSGSTLYVRNLESKRFATTLVPSLTPAPTSPPQSWGITDIYGTLAIYTPIVPVDLCPVPAKLTKSFSPTSVAIGQSSVLTLTINNATGNPVKTGINFIDTLPQGLVANGISSNSCGGQASIGSGAQVTLTGGAFSSGTATCQVVVQIAGVAATATGQSCKTYQNDTTNFSGLANVTAAGAKATLDVTCPVAATSTLRIEKSGNAPLPILPNGNINGIFAFDVTCTTPAGAQWINPSNPITLNYLGASVGANVTGIPVGSTCTILERVNTSAYDEPKVGSNIVAIGNVITTTNGYAVTTSAVQAPSAASTLGGLVIFRNHPVVSKLPASITKSFAPASITQTQTSVLTFTVNNTTGNPAMTGINFTDNLPSGMAATNVLANTCGGTAAAPGAMSPTINLTGGSLPAGPSSCTIQVQVSVQSSAANSPCKQYINNGTNFSGLANASATNANAVLNVTCPPATTSLRVYKSANAIPGAASNINGVFNFNVNCTTPSGAAWTNPSNPVSVNYAGVSAGVSVAGIPVGSTCNVTELVNTQDYGTPQAVGQIVSLGPVSKLATGYAVTTSAVQAPVAPSTVGGAVLFSNVVTGKTQAIKIVKAVTTYSPSYMPPAGAYSFTVTCGSNVYSGTINYPGTLSYQTPFFPATTTPCTVQENQPLPVLQPAPVAVKWDAPVFELKSGIGYAPIVGSGWSRTLNMTPSGVIEIRVINKVIY